MRRIYRVRGPALVLAILVGFAASACGALVEHRAGIARASAILRVRGPDLPAPITITAGYGSGSVRYQIARDGSVRRIPAASPGPFPRDASSGFAPGVWWAVRHHHLVIGRGQRSLWHSHGEFPSVLDINMVQADSHAVAFSYGNNTLYLAPLHGGEQPIARAEFALGFTNGGLYTNQWGHRLLLRSYTGAVLKTIVRRPLQWDYFVLDGSLYFIKDGMLMRARGTSVKPLVSLGHLGLSAESVSMQRLDPLLQLEDQHRLVLLRPDGSLFASTPLRGSQYRAENEVNLLAPVASTSAIAFMVWSGQTSGLEPVYVLRAGGHRAIPVDRQSVNFGGCSHWVNLEWHGSWLLYNDVQGHLALIDTTGPHRTIELSRLVGALHGTRAYWSGQPEL